MSLGNTVIVRVDFPALSDFIAYLRENQQAKIDELATTVKSLTESLSKSSTKLKDAVVEESK